MPKAVVFKAAQNGDSNSLSSFEFTPLSDSAKSLKDGWVSDASEDLFALSGDDLVRGESEGKGNQYGIINQGRLFAEDGRDTLYGESRMTSAEDIREGDRRLYKNSAFGIDNTGLIDMASDDDSMIGSGVGNSAFGIRNAGSILVGSGADYIDGVGAYLPLELDLYSRGFWQGVRGILVEESGLISTGDGADQVRGTAIDSGLGIGVDGEIRLADGDDLVYGVLQVKSRKYAYYPDNSGISIGGLIQSGSNDDKIIGLGGSKNPDQPNLMRGNGIRLLAIESGVSDGGLVDTGSGDDRIEGTYISEVGARGIFLDQASSGIHTGNGDDIVNGFSVSGNDFSVGINIEFSAIVTGSDDDRIQGTGNTKSSLNFTGFDFIAGIRNSFGLLDAGTGNDEITGRTTGNNEGFGIINDSDSKIKTGVGNDTVTGIGQSDRGSGIRNNGIVDTGAGNDKINALKGGFSGGGTYDLGADEDVVFGFGTGIFKGGAGTDYIRLGNGVYDIGASSISLDGITMNIEGFEFIGGLQMERFQRTLFPVEPGILTVTDGGVTFAPLTADGLG